MRTTRLCTWVDSKNQYKEDNTCGDSRPYNGAHWSSVNADGEADADPSEHRQAISATKQQQSEEKDPDEGHQVQCDEYLDSKDLQLHPT